GDAGYLERLRRAVVDLRSLRDEIQDDSLRFGRVCRPEHPDAVRFEGGCGSRDVFGVRHGTELTLDGLVEIELKFGGHGPLLLRGGRLGSYMLALAHTLRPK